MSIEPLKKIIFLMHKMLEILMYGKY